MHDAGRLDRGGPATRREFPPGHGVGDGAYTAPMRACYDVIQRPRRLSWTETDTGMRSEVELTDLGDGTTEVITILIDPPEGYANIEGRRGFQTSLDRMVAYTRAAAGCAGIGRT